MTITWPGRPSLTPAPEPDAGPALELRESWPASDVTNTAAEHNPAAAVATPGDATLIDGDAVAVIDAWRRDDPVLYELRRPRLIYLDPPFATGETFPAVLPIGERRPGQPTLRLPAYRDIWPGGLPGYLTMMAGLLSRCHDLLAPDGWLCLHCDHRTSAHLRLLLDELFGPDALRNEIVWSYGLGNSASRRGFPRKHDTLLLYARSAAAPFFPVRGEVTAAMANKYRHTRPDGTRFMRSYGREYDLQGGRPVGSVWDIPSVSPTSAERTAYPTQKPLALLAQLIASTTRPGDVVLDPCCGSGTTLLAATLAGRRAVGIDRSPLAVATTRARLVDAGIALRVGTAGSEAGPDQPAYPPSGGHPAGPGRSFRVTADICASADGTLSIELTGLSVAAASGPSDPAGSPGRFAIAEQSLVERRPGGEERTLTADWPEWIEGWAVGIETNTASEDVPFIAAAAVFRSGRRRLLPLRLTVNDLALTPVTLVQVRLFDLFGATHDQVFPIPGK